MKGEPATHCKGCGRKFSRFKAELEQYKQYCRRATQFGSYCDDKRCRALRRLAKPDEKIRWKGVKSHCTENIIKMTEIQKYPK
jgi:hypothetical protein